MNDGIPTPRSLAGSATLPLPTAILREPRTSNPVLRVHGLSKTYQGNARTGRSALCLFQDLSFEVAEGELVAIVGQSGSGKSTLLHMLGALDTPSAGTIYCASTQVTKLSTREAARFRNQQIGYVWQFHYLLPEFTAQENVAMPLLARGMARRDALPQALHWLAETGLADRADHRPGELSGGEQQRVALARALVTQPRLLLADEPTGDLDGQSADLVFKLIQRLHEAYALTSILVTHNLELAGRCTRTLRLAGGRFAEVPHGNSHDEAFATQ